MFPNRDEWELLSVWGGMDRVQDEKGGSKKKLKGKRDAVTGKEENVKKQEANIREKSEWEKGKLKDRSHLTDSLCTSTSLRAFLLRKNKKPWELGRW